MDDQILRLLREEVHTLRQEVRELRDEFQRAKGTVIFLKWMLGISIAITGLWYKLRSGA